MRRREPNPIKVVRQEGEHWAHGIYNNGVVYLPNGSIDWEATEGLNAPIGESACNCHARCECDD